MCSSGHRVSSSGLPPYMSAAAIGLMNDANAAESFRDATLLFPKKAMELFPVIQAEANPVSRIKALAVIN
ncbi:MAG: hypothetical protein AB7I42_11500 [Bradyrhizobium sp.]|uniref:hypothetical protein n=1 Tax=Bradyrhizobium sp. TaxID=376 RepID=UPI003D0A7EA8